MHWRKTKFWKNLIWYQWGLGWHGLQQQQKRLLYWPSVWQQIPPLHDSQLQIICQLKGHSYNPSYNFCFLLTFTFSRCICPKRLTVIHTNIHTLMAVAATQGAYQHIRSSLGFSILPISLGIHLVIFNTITIQIRIWLKLSIEPLALFRYAHQQLYTNNYVEIVRIHLKITSLVRIKYSQIYLNSKSWVTHNSLEVD